MTPQELKISILQLALQGKLVEQRPDEGSGKELYKLIRSENSRLIKAGILKKVKYSSDVTRDELAFDIPDAWHVVRFSEIGQLLDGEKKEGVAYPYLDAKFLRGKSEASTLTNGKYVTAGTKLILVDGENSGEVFDAICDGYMGSTFKVLYYSSLVEEKYVLYFLLFHKADYRNNKKGSAIPHLNKELFFNMPMPLPPLAEQKRIADKIEAIMPLIDRYEEAWTKIEAFNKRFPFDMQQSILYMAVQGKLIPQDPADGSGEALYQTIQKHKADLIKKGKFKKEKMLPDISQDEIPFEIPESWKWVRLSEICNISDGTHQTPHYVERGMPFISAQNVKPYRFIPEVHRDVSYDDYLEYNKVVAPSKGDILMTRVGAGIGEAAIIDQEFDFSIYVSLTLIKCYLPNYDMNYILHVINSPLGVALAKKKTLGKGASQGNLNLCFIREFVIPLPPLAEQKRIVAKLEEMLPICERLK